MIVATRGRGVAVAYDDDGRCLGRLVRLPNGWQAWTVHGDRPAEFVGWSPRRRDAAELLASSTR